MKKKKFKQIKKNEISKVASKKTPTYENKIEKLKKEKLNAVPMPDEDKQKIQPKEEKSRNLQEINDENIKKIVQTKKPILDEKKVKQVSEFEKKEN